MGTEGWFLMWREREAALAEVARERRRLDHLAAMRLRDQVRRPARPDDVVIETVAARRKEWRRRHFAARDRAKADIERMRRSS